MREFLENCMDGSSPRTRGTVVGIEERMTKIRFIPAHAGNR